MFAISINIQDWSTTIHASPKLELYCLGFGFDDLTRGLI